MWEMGHCGYSGDAYLAKKDAAAEVPLEGAVVTGGAGGAGVLWALWLVGRSAL